MKICEGIGRYILVLVMLLCTCTCMARETPKYSYELLADPSSFLVLSSSYSVDFSDEYFEKSLMISGWHDANKGRWAGKEETAEMFLPLLGSGTQEIELVCHALSVQEDKKQIMTIHAGTSEVWQGHVGEKHIRIRFQLNNEDQYLKMHRLRFAFSNREKPSNGNDSRLLSVNFKFINVNRPGKPERASNNGRGYGLQLRSEEVLLMPLASPQTVPCELNLDISERPSSGTVWLVNQQGEARKTPLSQSLHVSLPAAPEGNRWIAVQLKGPSTLQSAKLSRTPSVSSKQNIILLTLDTVRADDLPFYGNEILDCPNLSLLAEEGIVFENAFSQCDGTNPSFSSIMSSRYVHEHGVLDLVTPLAEKFETLAEVLKKDGYNTAAFISVVFLTAENSGLNQGFDVYSSVNDWQRRDREAKETTETLLTWLAVGASEPYFVWLHYYDAHTPYQPPEDIAKKYYPGDPVQPGVPPLEQSLPGADRHNFSWLGPVTDPEYPYLMHLGEIERMDKEIGRIWSSVKDAGGWENLVVMLTADHGESFGEKEVYFAHHGVHDANLHVPFVWRTPSKKTVGKRYGQLVESLDIAPTIYSLLAIDKPPETSGRSLARLVWPEVAKGIGYEEKKEIFAEQVAMPQLAAAIVRTNRLKLVVPNPLLQDEYLNYEHALYDIRKDPAEETNIIEEAPAEAKRLREIFDRWNVEGENITTKDQKPIEDDKWKALKDLGYAN